jgi:hypothetical protein
MIFLKNDNPTPHKIFATMNGNPMLEGLGGPVHAERYSLEGIDPTLDSCCQREEADSRRSNALRRTLQRFDVVAEKERRRRHLVTTEAFDGCRCCYDPNSDGGEYRALLELRELRAAQSTETVEAARAAADEEANEKAEEDDSDDEFDYLLDEDIPGEENEEIKMLEESRRAELEWEMLLREIAIQHGYGVHRQLHPNRVLKAAGLASEQSLLTADNTLPAVVLHLVDADSRASASLDLYLESLATRYAGTKFMRSSGRATVLMNAELVGKVFLPHKLEPDADMPVLIAVRDGRAVNMCVQLHGLVSRDNGEIDPSAVHDWLDRSGVLLERIPRSVQAMCRIRPEEEALMDYLLTMKPQQQEREEERYNCGLASCSKPFPHEHVGEKTEEQDGLVVSKDVVLNGAVE